MAALASKQWGRIATEQLGRAGVSSRTVGRWRDSYLFWELPRVYAVGHPGQTIESDHAAAVLYAGPGGMLDAASAIWWFGLLKYRPRQIFVCTPRRVQDWKHIVVRRERKLERIFHRGMPITTPSQAILDYAQPIRRATCCGSSSPTPSTTASSTSAGFRA